MYAPYKICQEYNTSDESRVKNVHSIAMETITSSSSRSRSLSSNRSDISVDAGSINSYDTSKYTDRYNHKRDRSYSLASHDYYQSNKKRCRSSHSSYSSYRSISSYNQTKKLYRPDIYHRNNSVTRISMDSSFSRTISPTNSPNISPENSPSRNMKMASPSIQESNIKINYQRDSWFEDLPLEWWERDDDCKDAKSLHLSKVDKMFSDREELVLQTTLWKEDTVLETNMFPYATPKGIKHYTLWSINDLSHDEIVDFVDKWLRKNMPQVRRWQYDDNSGERSICLFHVHVFIETIPYSFQPRPGEEYFPPHVKVVT